MDNNTVDLAHKRRLTKAENDEDGGNKHLLPIDALLVMIEDIKSGKLDPTSLMIIWDDRKTKNCGFVAANCDNGMMISMMEERKFLLLHDWFGK